MVLPSSERLTTFINNFGVINNTVDLLLWNTQTTTQILHHVKRLGTF